MKFAETLASQITPEWRTQYLRYDEMKAMLYDALESAPMFDADIVAGGADADDREAYQAHIQQFQDQFFSLGDRELTKINTFFSEKLSEALRKYCWLKNSVKYFQFKQQEIVAAAALNKASSHTTSAAILDSNSAAATPLQQNGSDIELGRHAADANNISNATQRIRRENTPTTWEMSQRDSVAFNSQMPGSAARRRGKFKRFIPMHLSEEDRKQSRRYRKINDLKLAFSEFYLSLILLQNYQNLNYTAFRKIMKKHDKLFKTSLGGEWKQKNVDVAPFFTSKEIDRLIVEVENMVTIDLEGGDRQRAMKRLRVPPLAERTTTWDFFRNGFALGSFAVLLACVIICTSAQGLPENTTWDVVIRMFRGHFFLVIFVFLCAFNVNGWANAGVNHVLIFELNPRNHLSHHNLLEIAGCLANLWCLTFLGFLFSHHLRIPQYAWPLILLGIIVAVFFCPLKIFYYAARKWLIYELFRCIAAPFFMVTFADFWLADQLNSLVVVLRDLQFLVCFYAVEVRWWEHPSPAGTCNSNLGTYGIRPLVAAFPAWIRFAQCLRRYRDTRLVFPHLLNAGKYATSFLVVLFSTLDSIDKEWNGSRAPSERVWFYAWILSAVVSSCFGYGWDVKMDWGFFDRRAARVAPLLREDMVYSTRWLYYFAIVEDFVLRFAWVISISVGEITAGFQEYLLIILGILELVRRFIWNYFRLENEHLNNCGQFRAVRDISIAPVKRDNLQKIEDMMDMEDGMHHNRYANIDDDDEHHAGHRGGRPGALLISKKRRHTLHTFVEDENNNILSHHYHRAKKRPNKKRSNKQHGSDKLHSAAASSSNATGASRRRNKSRTTTQNEAENDENTLAQHTSGVETEHLLSSGGAVLIDENRFSDDPLVDDAGGSGGRRRPTVTARRTSEGDDELVGDVTTNVWNSTTALQQPSSKQQQQPVGMLLEMRRVSNSAAPNAAHRQHSYNRTPNGSQKNRSGTTSSSSRHAAEMRAIDAEDATRDGVIGTKRRAGFNQSHVSSSTSSSSSSVVNHHAADDNRSTTTRLSAIARAESQGSAYRHNKPPEGPLSVVGVINEAQQREQRDAAAAAGAADAVSVAAASMHADDEAERRRQRRRSGSVYNDSSVLSFDVLLPSSSLSLSAHNSKVITNNDVAAADTADAIVVRPPPASDRV